MVNEILCCVCAVGEMKRLEAGCNENQECLQTLRGVLGVMESPCIGRAE